MEVTSQDIQTYNDHLNGTEIARAYNQLKAETGQAVKEWAVAEGKVDEKVYVRGVSQIPSEKLSEIAQNLGLDPTDAKILLYKGFGTKIVD